MLKFEDYYSTALKWRQKYLKNLQQGCNTVIGIHLGRSTTKAIKKQQYKPLEEVKGRFKSLSLVKIDLKKIL